MWSFSTNRFNNILPVDPEIGVGLSPQQNGPRVLITAAEDWPSFVD